MLDYLRTMYNARLARMEERGASAVEYGLLIAGIAALIVVAVFALGPIVKEAFTDTCTSIHDSDGSTVTTASCSTTP
jgi:pilus assembly protein Flp/PilA